MKSARSASHALVRRVIAAGDSPASVPKNSLSAGRKSPEDNPCRYSSGSTCDTLGDLRA